MSVKCQACSQPLTSVLNLGYMPPPNEMPKCEGHDPKPQTWLPTELMFCEVCGLAQLGYIPDQGIAFPEDYPYRSGATPALRRNFEELAVNANHVVQLGHGTLVVDIGSNDGTLLECFGQQQNKLGIEPTVAAFDAIKKGINTEKLFFGNSTAHDIRNTYGQAKLITCANCFAHMPNIHDVIEGIKTLLRDDGIFVSESHYLIDLINKLQYDTIYAEHLRYYTVHSIVNLLNKHGLQVFKVDRIPTHGGSIRVYAKKGTQGSVTLQLATALRFYIDEVGGTILMDRLYKFAAKVQASKLKLLEHLAFIKSLGGNIVGIGAPSRASTVINYARLDSGIIDYICEQSHSDKLGRFMPGTDIPVVDEKRLYDEQPTATILFSWHLAETLIPNLRAKGYRGEIILPCET